jgi:hypothetical protein
VVEGAGIRAPCLQQPTNQEGLASKEDRPHKVVTPETFSSIDHLTAKNTLGTEKKTSKEDVATK